MDVLLEDEEQFADQLKEYYAFGDSLRSVIYKIIPVSCVCVIRCTYCMVYILPGQDSLQEAGTGTVGYGKS